MIFCINHSAYKVAKLRFSRGLFILLSLFLSVTSLGQSKKPSLGKVDSQRSVSDASSPDLKTLNVLADTDSDYLISAGDVISIQIEDAPELSRTYRVSAAGIIKLAWIGQLTVQNKTTEGFANELAEVLRKKEYLLEPNVVVSVNQYNSQTYFLQGAVNKPGYYQVEGRPTMLKLIGLAGGLIEGHGTTAFIVRRKKAQNTQLPSENNLSLEPPIPEESINNTKPSASVQSAESEEDPDYEMVKLNLAALYKGHFEENQRLTPGDIVNIPRSDVFFVAGEVNAPGSFTLKEGTTLRQAVSLAQGTTFRAKLGRGLIFREDPNTGHRQELPVDIGAVMNGKAEDLTILPNDVIIIPNSRMKSVGSTLLSAFGANAARIPIRY